MKVHRWLSAVFVVLVFGCVHATDSRVGHDTAVMNPFDCSSWTVSPDPQIIADSGKDVSFGELVLEAYDVDRGLLVPRFVSWAQTDSVPAIENRLAEAVADKYQAVLKELEPDSVWVFFQHIGYHPRQFRVDVRPGRITTIRFEVAEARVC